MNILYLCFDRGIPALGAKGASAHVRQFIAGLASEGHRVNLMCAQLGKGNPSPPCDLVELAPVASSADVVAEARRRGITSYCDKVLLSELAKLADDRELANRVLTEIRWRKVRVDAIYERYALFHQAGEAVARRLRVPRILEVNAPLADESRRYRGLRLRTLAESLERAIFAGADHLAAVSNEVRDHIASCGVSPNRILVVPNAVDPALFSPAADGSIVRDRYGLARKTVVGFVGSLKPWHGIDFLLDAFRRVKVIRPGAALLIVGDGPGLEGIRRRVRLEHLDDCVFTPGVVPHSEVPAHVAAMDVCVAPYERSEHFYFSPLKVVEYMAVAKPVVAPAFGELARVVEDGVTGMLYKPGNIHGFVRKIVQLIDDRALRSSLGLRAAEQVHAHRTWRASAKRIVGIMDDLNRRSKAEKAVHSTVHV